MKKVICFSLCDKNYIDMVKVALYSFFQYNDLEMKVFLTDDSSEVYKEAFKDFDFYDKLEFIDFCQGTKTKEYIDKHFDDFKTFKFCFDKSGILNVTIANEVTDYMSSRYANKYEVILRLDLDVIFFNSVVPSIDNFIKSGKALGGCFEHMKNFHLGRSLFKLDDYVKCRYYINAGNLMYRTKYILRNQFERMCNLFEKLGFEKFHYFDQDTVNLMYNDDSKYNAVPDGWIIPIIPLNFYGKFIEQGNCPVNIHFVGAYKPFLDYEKYKSLNLNYKGTNDFYLVFPFYLETARIVGCSETFCENIERNYGIYKDLSEKDPPLFKMLVKILEKRSKALKGL